MMKKYNIDATNYTPEIIFNEKNKTILLKGKSLPENSTEFYTPVLEWISEYVKKPNKTTNLICNNLWDQHKT